jgi:hypothetical protein
LKKFKYAKVMNKPTRGGPRPGAGAPKKPPTKIITFRVRLDEVQQIKDLVKSEIKKIRLSK